MDPALHRLPKQAKKASLPAARTSEHAGKDGFFGSATYLAQGSLYVGLFGANTNTSSALLELDNKDIPSQCTLSFHPPLALLRVEMTAK